MRRAFIYTLAHPLTGEIRYVGKTVRNINYRLQAHLKCKNISHKNMWIKSLKNNGLIPIIELIEETVEDNVSELEKFYISYFKFLGFRLTNLTEGGEGSSGYKHRKESIDKIRKAVIKRGVTREQIMKGVMTRIQTGVYARLADSRRGKRCYYSSKPVIQKDLNGNIIKEWSCIKEAAESINANPKAIYECLRKPPKRGLFRTSNGYRWERPN